MTTTQIKICGIKTSQMAAFCAKAGAQFIGLVFCEQSPRFVDINTAKQIADVAKQENIIPVAVFSDANESTIVNVCRQTGISYVQLHGDRPRNIALLLPNELRRIYVNPDNPCYFLRPKTDFVLFDSPQGGSGKVINWNTIQPPQDMRFFLAGGLTANNVKQAILTAHPFAVDVSSGVESSRGEKSELLITQFIAQVNEVNHA